MRQQNFKVGARVMDTGYMSRIHGTVIDVGPAPYFDCEVRWDEPKDMDGEEFFLEAIAQEFIAAAPLAAHA